MSTFALVHGAWHGSWCWEALAPELMDPGHDVVAVDLPGEDPAAGFGSTPRPRCSRPSELWEVLIAEL